MTQKKIQIDLTKLEPLDELDAEEKALHHSLQTGNFELDHSSHTINHYAEIFTASRNQRKAISLRLPKQDYLAIKSKASELGLPYQALINSLIHRYVAGHLKEA